MNLVQVTPGTGNFYCGSCLRDHALARTLHGLGHDVMVVPMYLPLVVEEPVANESGIFFGGVNVYAQQKSALFRNTPRWVDRLLDAPGLLNLASRRAGMTTANELGELTLSILRGIDGFQAKEVKRLVGWLRNQEKPDVLCLSNGMLVGLAQPLRAELGVPVVCTLQGEDSFLDALPPEMSKAAWALFQEQAQHVDAFIAVSEYYGQHMRDRLAIGDERIHVVHNGVDISDAIVRSQVPEPPVLGFMARLCPEKGLHRLVDAYLELIKKPPLRELRLALAGSCTPADRQFLEEQKKKLATAGAGARVVIETDVSRQRKLAFLSELSLLSVPALYGEAFGLYVVEALAAGVPVVQPQHAAFPELIAATGGGRLYSPDDDGALTRALAELLTDSQALVELGQRGRAVVEKKFTTHSMAQAVLSVLEPVVRTGIRR